MKRRKYFRLVISAVCVCAALAITACVGKPMASDSNATVDEEVNDSQEKRAAEIEEKSRTAYLRNPDAIDLFCKVMKVEKKDLTLIYNFNTEENLTCYDIGVKGKPDLAGTYIFTEYIEKDDQVTRGIAKKVTSKEKEERNLKEKLGEKQCNAKLYEFIYHSDEAEDMGKDSAELLPIDTSHVKEYKEERFGTGDIWECWNGYINEDDNFAVSYYGDVSGWTSGVFQNKKWTTRINSAIGDETEYHYFTDYDMLWNFDSDTQRLQVGDKNGKEICDIQLEKWCEENDMPKGIVKEVTALSKEQAIFSCLPDYRKENEYKAFIVDLKSGKSKKSYDRKLGGINVNGLLYMFYSYTNVLEVVDLETGESVETVDYSSITDSTDDSIEYVIYSDEMGAFCEVENGKGDYPVRHCVNRNNGEVYFSYFSGVYRYNREEKKLEQIVDGEKQKLFKDMFGSIAVGADGKIYMLGFIGGGDDEGPIDFLYMTPKE